MRNSRTIPAGAPALSAVKIESTVESTFDSLVALQAGDAGSHGVEKPVEPPGALSGCACAIAKPSATISAKPSAKLTHLRTMNRSYTRPQGRAIQVVPERRWDYFGRAPSRRVVLCFSA